jgi:DNA-directed RNA polymerase alpha subunit
MKADLDTKIEEMDFVVPPWGSRMATRVRNGLLRGGVLTLGQLLEQTDSDLETIDEGLGIVSREIIKIKLKSMGLKLKGRQ